MIKTVLIKLQRSSLLHSWLLLIVLDTLLGQGLVNFLFTFCFSDVVLSSSFIQANTTFLFFLYSVIIGPLIETLVFQAGGYLLLKEGFRCNAGCIALCSGVVFGCLHYYSVSDIVSAFIMGVLFQLWYIIYLKKYGWKRSLLLVAGAHGLNNLMAFFLI